MPASDWAKALTDQLFVSGEATDLIDDQEGFEKEWSAFADSWSRLPVDAFMAHGETYRLRRHSVFNVSGTGDIEELAAKPYLQPLAINHLNGDVLRTYDPIEREIAGGGLFRDLLTGITAVLTCMHGPHTWHHQCFQNRILAGSGTTGQPTPEGIHRDGVDYVVTLLVNRHNIGGGESGIYDAESRRKIHSQTLLAPGDMLLADDAKTLHDATPIEPQQDGEGAYRDVFIDVITRGTRPH
ncbi:2OG-Fe dioxygenase family protein [Streptomyces sp. NPDC048462]|uniref:2OG-Fe dioxygenase family protein n=1 Tax=Streptomyces sp. NPDC048462 TaxID=3365555 RepID=UPI003713D70C